MQVLIVLEEKVKRRAYGSLQVREFLQFETESVPVHQFQARVAELVLRHGGKGLNSLEGHAQMVPIINLALRVSVPKHDLESSSVFGQSLLLITSHPFCFLGVILQVAL